MDKSVDKQVLKTIQRLVEQEQDLYQREDLSEEDRMKLKHLEVELDQCWDLLRQRRALREFGKDPDEAKVRPEKIVEDYEN
jgi:hypothetical protein